mmetsp:Transcript_36870/g.42186  ORF Transcript_36870/g.42186 Transcript_36870/m.42186 type:complete len:276 (-) Transcript_36870:17-844(-)
MVTAATDSLDAIGTGDSNISSAIYVLVFAHPDDESMFFLPTIRFLIDKGDTVWLLCLTTGNYDGLGKIREKEITEVGKMLGVSKVITRDDEKVQDHPTERWDKGIVSTAIRDSLKREGQNGNRFVLITFDALGISAHVNHTDVYYGVQHLNSKSENATDKEKYQLQILEVWYLESEENLLFKYIPLLSWILLMISFFNDKITSTCTNYVSNKNNNTIRVYRMHNPVLNWKAMATHHSQFVWYRRLFVVFSCYTYCNKLTLISRMQHFKSKNTGSI